MKKPVEVYVVITNVEPSCFLYMIEKITMNLGKLQSQCNACITYTLPGVQVECEHIQRLAIFLSCSK